MTIRTTSVIERKDPRLPRFVTVPADRVEAAWRPRGTVVVDLTLNGVELGRRSLKAWGEGRDCWFVDLTRPQCEMADVDTGDEVVVELRRAATALPGELSALIGSNEVAAQAWAALSASRRRRVAEHVRAAKRKETRIRRARRALVDSR